MERNELSQVRVLTRQARSSPDARHFVVDVLNDWGLVGMQDDAALVVAELVSNALRHTGTPSVRVIVRRMPSDTVRLIVIDKHPELWPARQSAGPLESGGRGLALVDAVTRVWGCTRLPREKYVWADLEVSKDA
ncbi:ATP-binding protein [Streptomyces sp. WELS2]|uniref:ATP-binding protein n=1 Tax=Streptomyces sp. WELS2 TaxID=2749435 RepID=UPI0015F0F1F2|nr:ATP-binding protein [Streptomyces sp. WELS2]